jgi:hypothetical protein
MGMQTTTGAILLVIGVVALFAAIVGGGVKIKEIEVGSLPSRWRQAFLAMFGFVVGVTGLYMVMNPGGRGSADAAPGNGETLDQPGETATIDTANDGNTADQATENATVTEANEAEAAPDSTGEESTQQ